MQIKENVAVTAEWLFSYEDINTGHKWTIGPYRNKVVQTGLENLATLMTGEVSSLTAATHCVIGSSDVAAAIDDDVSDMGEVERLPITSKSHQGAIARLRTFFGSGEGNGDHECVGLVARATDQTGSGTLINRLVQPFSKASNQVLTIEVLWTFQGV